MSKPSDDVLKFLQQYEGQKSALPSGLTRLPPLKASVIRPPRKVLFSPLSAELANLASIADAKAESIYNEQINVLVESDEHEEVAAIPRIPTISPLDPSSITIQFQQLHLSAAQTMSRAGKPLERTTKSLDFSAQVRELSTTVAPRSELAPSLAYSAPPTITTRFLQKRLTKLKPIKQSPATDPIESRAQSAPAEFPEPKPHIVVPPMSSIVPKPALADDLTVVPPYYASLPRLVRSGCFTAWDKGPGGADTSLPRATQQSCIPLSLIVRQAATPPATLSELLLEPQQVPGQIPQDLKQHTSPLPTAIRQRF